MLALAVAAVGLGGCGYSFRGSLPSHIQTIAVPIFENRTLQPNVDSIITRAVVQAFATDGRLRVVRRADADAILEGQIVRYRVDAIAYDSNLNILAYRLTLGLNLTMRDVRRNTLLLNQAPVSEQAEFRVAGSVATTIDIEESALAQAADTIARNIVSYAIQRF
jgi:outer membrane lipopolysaccharide assembly protein LptE/RlpB